MSNLVIDIGNTYSKIALFNNRELEEIRVSETADPGAIADLFGKYEIGSAIVSTVGPEIERLEAFLKERCRYLRFHTGLQTGIVSHYKTPATLGADRYAAVIGASVLFPGSDCLVIDSGTCVTCDFVDRNRNYYGGSISPGIRMRFKAMNTFTERLPLVEFDETFDGEYGQDTKSAMMAGVVNGIIYEVSGVIGQYYKKWPGLRVLLCGGDVNFFDRQLKNSIFARNIKAEPNLVLIGLNEVIHQYNE